MRAIAIVAAFATVASASPARAIAAPTESAAESQSATVLGLDADERGEGEAATAALRRAMERRGYAPGTTDVSLAELRLAWGCDNDEPRCLAQGAAAFDNDVLVYGALVSAEGKRTAQLAILDVAQAIVKSQVSVAVSDDQLQADQIDATADELVASLLGEPEPEAMARPLEATVPEPTPARDEADTPGPAPGTGNLVWGAYAPRPAWKRGLLAGSLSVTGVGLVMIGYGLGTRGRTVDRTVQAAVDSTMDGISDGETTIGSDGLPTVGSVPNDVPNVDGVDLCRVARHSPDPSSDAVWNADVATECRRGDTHVKIATVGWVFTAFGLAGTATAVTLMFVRRRPQGARQFGITPTLSGAQIHARF